MKPFKNKLILVFLALLILLVLIPLIMFLILTGQHNQGQPPMPISHPATTQALAGVASWPVSSHNVLVCASESSSLRCEMLKPLEKGIYSKQVVIFHTAGIATTCTPACSKVRRVPGE
jgi:hypothetical protein